MASFGDVAPFPRYEVSESLAITFQLYANKFTQVQVDMLEIDTLIAEDMKKNTTGGKVSLATKQKVDKDLQEIEQVVAKAKQEMAAEFYQVVEKLRQEGKELQLKQRFDFELLIDELNFVVEYTKKFEELFNRINSL